MTRVVIHNHFTKDEGGDIQYKGYWVRNDGDKFWVEDPSGKNLGSVRNNAQGKSKIEGELARNVTPRVFGAGR